jgi:predicted nicotinamide N-methyase
MELWHIGFGAGVVAVFAFFMIALALASRDYDRFKQQRDG